MGSVRMHHTLVSGAWSKSGDDINVPWSAQDIPEDPGGGTSDHEDVEDKVACKSS